MPLTRWGWPLAVVGAGVVTSCAVAIGRLPVTVATPGWELRSPLLVGAAVALVVAGALSRSPREGSVLAALGALWLVPELGWVRGAAGWAVTLGAVTASLLVLLALLLVAVRTGRLGSVLGIAVAAAGTASAVRLFLVDPFTSSWCWYGCSRNPWALSDTGAGLEVTLLLSALVLGTVYVVERGLAQTDPPFAVGVTALLAGLVAPVLFRRFVPEAAMVGRVAFGLSVVGALVVAFAVVGPRLREVIASIRLVRLAGSLSASPQPEELAAVVGRAVGDRRLVIGYWDGRRRAYLDPSGRSSPWPDDDDSRRRRTLVTRDGHVVAAVDHDAAIESGRLDRALGPAWRLVLENAQMRATAMAELREARTVRAQVVDRGTAERRRLERDLHDGVQQRVVSLALLTRMLADRVAGRPEQAAADRAVAATSALLEELRRVARGLFPAVLADSGLAGGLEELADSAGDVVVDLRYGELGALAPTVEATAYQVCATALAEAGQRRATILRIGAQRSGERLVIDVEDDGAHADAFVDPELADRVAAISGTLTSGPTGAGRHIRLEVPCES